MLDQIKLSDIPNIVFLRSYYLILVSIVSLVVLLSYATLSFRIRKLYKAFGGYQRCKLLAKQNHVSLVGPLRLTGKTVLMGTIALLLGLTLLIPAVKDTITEKEYEPANIVIVLDRTISMLAEDITPSRIVAAKGVIMSLLDRIKKEGGKDKVGLLGLTDIAVPMVAIPTKNYGLLEQELRRMTTNHLKIFENHGTNIWDGVTQGLENFEPESELAKILIIISDGEQVAEDKYIDETREQALLARGKNKDVKIFVVWIGKTTEPSLIPKEKDALGNVTKFYTQTEGEYKGKLIETPDPSKPDPLLYMQEIASQTNGEFILSESAEDLSMSLNDILSEERKVIGVNQVHNFKNLSPLFIAATLVLLFFVPLFKLD